MGKRRTRLVEHAAWAVMLAGVCLAVFERYGHAAETISTDRLEGTWRYRSTGVGGETLPGPSGFNFVFRGGKALFRVDHETQQEYAYRVDGSHTPAHIDLIEQTDQGEIVHRGILALDGDTIRWCETMAQDGPRPTSFVTRSGDHNMLRVLFRVPDSVLAPTAASDAAPAGAAKVAGSSAGQPAAAAGPATPLAMPRRFKLTLLETPGGQKSVATDLNNRGQVVGEVGEREVKRPCVWTAGRLEVPTAFDRPAATIYGINDDGVLAGTHVLGQQGTPYLYDNGQLLELPLDIKYPVLLVYGVNSRRQVVGVAFHPLDVTGAWMWENGKIRSLGALGGYCAEAMAINERGQVAGFANSRDYGPSHACLWGDGQPQDLGTLGGSESKAYDLNDSGQVVGVSNTASGQDRAFLWSEGRMQDLGVLPGGRTSHAWSVNNSGMVTGWSRSSAGQQRAVLWYQGNIHDLNDLVDDLQGWTLAVARAVNNHGSIAGTAVRNGQQRAFLLEPVFDGAGRR